MTICYLWASYVHEYSIAAFNLKLQTCHAIIAKYVFTVVILFTLFISNRVNMNMLKKFNIVSMEAGLKEICSEYTGTL